MTIAAISPASDPPVTSPDAIHVSHLSHAYAAPPRKPRAKHSAPLAQPETSPRTLALDDVSLSVGAGEIFGILGPNGSGKTTLFRILATLLRPLNPAGHCGSVAIFGHDCVTDAARVREQLGVVFQAPSLDGKLTARENLMHQGHLYGLRGPDLDHRIDEQLAYFALTDRRDELVERFSGGMRRRVELAKALLHRPPLLLLDEPATGLDPGARHDLWRQLLQLRNERRQTVALTTHLMDEADRCDRLAVMSQGRLVAIDTPANLKARIGGDVITLAIAGGDAAVESVRAGIEQRFGPWQPGAAPTAMAGRIRLERPQGASFIPALAEAFPGRFDSITVGQPTLEDVFLHLTGHALWNG
jgi:ABC-2 type transport system ATP-binding protein